MTNYQHPPSTACWTVPGILDSRQCLGFWTPDMGRSSCWGVPIGNNLFVRKVPGSTQFGPAYMIDEPSAVRNHPHPPPPPLHPPSFTPPNLPCKKNNNNPLPPNLPPTPRSPPPRPPPPEAQGRSQAERHHVLDVSELLAAKESTRPRETGRGWNVEKGTCRSGPNRS